MEVTPSRVGLARRRRGLTKTALAQAIGVSSRSISAFEAGEMRPSEETLEKLSAALGFPQAFFGGPDLEEVSVDAASFRSMSRMTASQRDTAFAAGTLGFLVSAWADERFHLPVVDVPTVDSGTPPEAAADIVRSEWGLGTKPIRNTVHLLERHGVRLFSLAQDAIEVDAFSLWRDAVPYVFLNTRKSAERGRFDASHELGHLVMHAGETIPRGKAVEDEANRFAGALLMPRDRVAAALSPRASLADLIHVKTYFRVSASALAHRAHELGVFTDWHYRRLCIEMSKAGWSKREPQPLPREQSRVFDKVLGAMRSEGIGLSDIAAELDLASGDLEDLVFNLTMFSLAGGNPGGGGPGDPPSLSVVSGGRQASGEQGEINSRSLSGA